ELDIEVFSEKQLQASKLIEWLKDEINLAYLKRLAQISKLDPPTRKQEKKLRIVFTPLHGTALSLVERGLKQLNFDRLHIVEKQSIPDPQFSTVASPNPEERQAFTEAIKLGKETDADILLATDPDADRLGVAVKNVHDEYE